MYPNLIDPFILDTDASDTAIGVNGMEQVIVYGIQSL